MFRRPHRPHCRQNPSPSLQLQLEVFVPTFITASEVAFVASHSVSPLTSSSSQEHRRVVSISIVPASPSSDSRVFFSLSLLLQCFIRLPCSASINSIPKPRTLRVLHPYWAFHDTPPLVSSSVRFFAAPIQFQNKWKKEEEELIV
ncbi:hypothetical protein PIB30_070685 [Stylosanthes scabra]|uniref:Uncharacterized protein n=1 Tax=Stylosanthes scabra TaxID=79078 RepID=A0ABU6RNX2_9FABA|nr:hypothetical protein [Stylosanthes scabra]